MNDPEKSIAAAEVRAEDGKLRGYHLLGPDGQLVLGRPDAVYLDREGTTVVVGGLKPGWKLGTDADVKRKVQEGKAADEARAKADKIADAGIKMEAVPSK